MTYIEWLEDKCLHILDESWVCDLMSEYADEWEYCQKHCENGKGECLRRLYTLLHKTEPSDSEKPNNCETCGTPKHLCKYCIEEDRMWTPKTEPLDKDTNVRSKEPQIDWHYSKQDGLWYPYKHEDEPQTCRNCKWSQTVCRLGDSPPCHSYEPKTEPQTDCAWGKGE